ncbi:MAG: hypothetical protein KF757_02625 [Phycisphaeraceae bacterium]|nr:hypothetical protein [Phycisphaeraceae bacterium]MCW5762106.1 hypothetical protein [Phycisphaeraceae bacterium]
MTNDNSRLDASERKMPNARRAEIRDVMLARADRRRRTRRIREASMMAACVGAAIGVGWLALRPTASPAPIERRLANDAQVERHIVMDPPAEAGPAIVRTSTVVSRAISDDELLELLHEAGEEAGLAIIGGEVKLVHWHSRDERKGEAG